MYMFQKNTLFTQLAGLLHKLHLSVCLFVCALLKQLKLGQLFYTYRRIMCKMDLPKQELTITEPGPSTTASPTNTWQCRAHIH